MHKAFLKTRRTPTILMIAAVLSLTVVNARHVQAVSGDISVHDPSMIVVDGCYYVFSTGGFISIRKSCDLSSGWTNIGNVFDNVPSWVFDAIGSLPTDLWAPDINFFNGQYYLYYAGSTFGSNRSVIGLATATNVAGPWTDQGEVLRSQRSDNFNAIDPNLAWDDDGHAWLSFGSFWDGIKMREIDPSTGKLLASDTTLYSLASRQGGAIEASSILHSGNYYYLFLSFDKCCAGVNSTYRIMVGRATKITGPYVDKNGTDMMLGGATELLASSGEFIGPGGQDVMIDGTTNRLVYHYYDGNDGGKSKLAVRNITIDTDGWPVLGPML